MELAADRRRLPNRPPRAQVALEPYAAAAVAKGLPWQGDLAVESALRLGFLAASTHATGRLHLRAPRATYVLTFRDGVAVHVASDDPRHQVATLLGACRTGNPAAAEAVERAAAGPVDELAARLAAAVGVEPALALQRVQEHARAVAAVALEVVRGSGAWQPGGEPPASAFALGTRAGLLVQAVRRFAPAGVRARLVELEHRATTLVRPQAVPHLDLDAGEARAASLLNGGRSIAELAAAFPRAADLLRRVALLLAETELLSFGAARPRPAPAAQPAAAVPPGAPAPAPAVPRTPTPRPGATPAVPRVLTPTPGAARAAPLDEKRLRILSERLRTADHFAALGVTRDASPETLQAVYVHLATQLHPAQATGEPPELRQLRSEAFARVQAAWAVLSDPAQRARHAVEVPAATSGVAAEMEAVQLFARGTVLVKSRQYPAAVESLGRAVALGAGRPEYAVWLAWAEFLAAAQPKARHAVSRAAIEAALKVEPRYAPAHLFLARMARFAGEKAEAEKHLRRGLQVDPEDAELQRELRYLNA
jgi:tetratricopeptide (TPR) repeat protein